ncbi:cob(I)yrinic acid a,c-diamide adenosyltransferase [Porphyromonas somerae]|uniref:cob(I)yrinic acid a,c-diamide adenosyltransferase n=1 Tax=Porphyromonas somerae TaxID=322095 RepID=UPI002A91CC1C|nr:cob(I)yrinic acid a,c-diamide adenosyltransferase [Porphyromonas somerae]MDY5815373.1 cob(I)yrinic acid a,c-diamide adenosyltransferase [Porphyromonas somerae]
MIQVYTGNGKGKSTAAFGMALRALGAGKRVYIAQFVKDMRYSECFFEDYFQDHLKIEQWGASCLLNREATDEDYAMAERGLERCATLLQNREGEMYDLIILDELNIALSMNLLPLEKVLDALKSIEGDREVIITGRYAPCELLALADLVTDMQEVKHYYQKGVLSRKGFDC